MRVLVITKIFPNRLDPTAAPYNRQQFAALGRLAEVTVLATLPWFPGAGALRRWSAAGRKVDVPAHEVIDGLEVHHPRVLYLPRIGHVAAGALYAASLLRRLAAARANYDVLLASWAFPDGAAVVALGELLGLPTVVKLHGSDINVLSRRWGPRANLRLALPRAGRVVAVSRPLADAVVALGVPRRRVALVANGVDKRLFCIRSQREARAALGLPEGGRLVLHVGRLQREKGVFDLLDAWARVAGQRPDLSLVLVGDGPARAECEARARAPAARVTLVGERPLDEVPRWIAACDALVLASHAEGPPNVLLEARACGRRVVATRVGGVPDLITSPELGELVPAHDPAALAVAIERVASSDYDPAVIAAIDCIDWAESAARLHAVLGAAIDEHRRRG